MFGHILHENVYFVSDLITHESTKLMLNQNKKHYAVCVVVVLCLVIIPDNSSFDYPILWQCNLKR